MRFVPSLTIPQLGIGAGYILRGFRAAALQHGGCYPLKENFQFALGDDADNAIECLTELVRCMCGKGIRPIRLGRPGCCWVTSDELSIVSMIASAQRDDHVGRDSHLRSLMGGHADERACLAVDTIGALFATSGISVLLPDVELLNFNNRMNFEYHQDVHCD